MPHPTDTLPDLGRAWCPTCRTRVHIDDQFGDELHEFRQITPVFVTLLACGHQLEQRRDDEARFVGGWDA